MNALEVQNLNKTFRRRGRKTVALDSMSLEVPANGIFGFLGPNGSGKTTTIRCLLRLITPASGTCTVLGADLGRLHQVQHRIGSIVETPTFFPTFSGLQNLSHLGRLVGRSARDAKAVLVRVGLEGREDDLVHTYSLGMKQRLGLAAALLKDPELLILDEPAHGLDPQGIKDIRVLLRELADEGRTVFLSSHLLNEIEAICERVAIVVKGGCVKQGRLDEVLAGSAGSGVLIQLSDADSSRAKALLAAAGFQVEEEEVGDLRIVSEKSAEEINRLLSQNGIYAKEIRSVGATLEDAYLRITGAP